jgi:ABC-type transport system involved in multi-copper enzyme maturation permease subunit
VTRTAVLSPALSKEIRALLPLWGASVAALAVAFVWRGGVLPDAGVIAYVAGSLAIGAHSIGQEYTCRTLPMLLSQPVDRRRVYLLKFAVSAMMLLTLAAVAWPVLADAVLRPDSWHFSIVVWPVLCGLFVAPLFTMICRSSLAGMILGASVPACLWLATLAVASLGFGLDVEAAQDIVLGYWARAMIVLCPVAGLFGWRRFRELEATEGSSPAFHLPRWLRSAQGARRHAPLRALAAKELHLQQLVFVVAALHIIGWAIFLLVQRYIPSLSTFPLEAVMLMYCMGLAIMTGALASAEERHHGTLDWQLLQPTPAWQQWMVKLGVALGLALLLGVGLTMLLIHVTPHEGFRAIRISADFTALIVLVTASSVYISSLSSSGVQAMAWSVPIGMAVALFMQTVSEVLRWVALKLAGPLMADIVTGAIAPLSVHPTDVVTFTARGFALTLAPLMLWFGFVNHTSSERSARRIFQQIASIAILIMTGIILVGGVLAFYELRAR